MNSLNNIINSKLKINIEFFNDAHKKLLCNKKKYPSDVVERMKKLVSDGLVVDGHEFMEYYLFHNKRSGIEKDDFIEMIPSASNILRMHFEIKNNQLFKMKNVALSKEITEHIGESVGMLVIAHCFNILSADWNFIPESNKVKTLDCNLAVSNNGLIELEAKGTSAVVINLSSPSSSITDKKKGKKSTKGNYFYGTITTIDTSNLTCYLLDPPGSDVEFDYVRLRFLNRLSYYYEILRVIAPTSELIEILMERIELVRDEFYDIKSLWPLKPKNRANFNYSTDSQPTFFFQSYYNNNDKVKFGGRFFYLQKGVSLFIGVDKALLNTIVEQSIDDLLTFSDELSYVEVNELVDRKAIQTTNRNHQDLNIEDKNFTNSERLKMSGRVYIKNGLALGVLNYS
ncbi:hypothetical protein [Lelliottia sp. WAP21]|uniref:hypothetical protein n=1 Tax=Lelliottia sp. WAP21 TaxID=2877426 RepID=UPI001E2832D7|nr:hypothetical protein [Lelliottia sp. WAP21]